MVMTSLQDLVGGKPFQKGLEEKQRKVLCAQTFLLFKMEKLHVPVNQHKYDQTTCDLVKQRAVCSLFKDI